MTSEDEVMLWVAHRDGVPCDAVEAPPWRHKCFGQTLSGHIHVEHPEQPHVDHRWCPCGGWKSSGSRRWKLRNTRRKTLRSMYVPLAILHEGTAMVYLGPLLFGSIEQGKWASAGVNLLFGLFMVLLLALAQTKTGGRSWDGLTPLTAMVPTHPPKEEYL